jgi:hypothetical protein
VVQEPVLRGRPSYGPRGLRILVDGAAPGIVDAASGSFAPVPGLRLDGYSTARLAPAGDRIVATIHRDGAETTTAFLLGSDGQSSRLGEDILVQPLRDGRLLLLRWVRGEIETAATVVTARGRVQRSWSTHGLLVAHRDTAHGLVVTRALSHQGAPTDLLLLDPDTGRVVRTIGPVASCVGVSDTLAAWTPSGCDDDCVLTVSNLESGEPVVFTLPNGRAPQFAAFSPDGRRLALSFMGLHPEVGHSFRDLRGFVAVLDMPTGTLTRLPGLYTQIKHAAGIGWSRDGRVLVLYAGWPDHARLAFWHPRHGLLVLPTVLSGPGEGTLAVLP